VGPREGLGPSPGKSNEFYFKKSAAMAAMHYWKICKGYAKLY